MGFFDKLKQGLTKTKESINEKINDAFSNFRKVDEDFLEELEEILIMSDIGMETSIKIIDNLRDKAKKEKIESEEELKKAKENEKIEVFLNKVLISELNKKKYNQSVFLEIENNKTKILETGTEVNFLEISSYIENLTDIDKRYKRLLKYFAGLYYETLLIGIKMKRDKRENI